VDAVTGVDIARSVPGVREAEVYVRRGGRVNRLLVNEDRIGHVLAVADDPYVAGRIAETAARQIAVATHAA
jgi:hypothetical protein